MQYKLWKGPSIYYVSIILDALWPTHWVSLKSVLNVSKTGHFLDSTSPFADIIYEWTLTIVRQKWNLKIKGQMSNVISRISRWVTFQIWCSNFLCKWVFTRYFLSYVYPRQTKWYSNKIWRFLQIFVAFSDYQADNMNLFLYSEKAPQIWWIIEISRLFLNLLKWVHPIIFVSIVFHNSHLIQKCIQNQQRELWKTYDAKMIG